MIIVTTVYSELNSPFVMLLLRLVKKKTVRGTHVKEFVFALPFEVKSV